MQGSVKKIHRTLFVTSVALFALAFASALFLPSLGLYLALGFVFVGSLFMLLASLVREWTKRVPVMRRVSSPLSEPNKELATA
jgi:hypothetical protein